MLESLIVRCVPCLIQRLECLLCASRSSFLVLSLAILLFACNGALEADLDSGFDLDGAALPDGAVILPDGAIMRPDGAVVVPDADYEPPPVRCGKQAGGVECSDFERLALERVTSQESMSDVRCPMSDVRCPMSD